MTGAEPKVTKELALSHGLTAEEYDRIIRRLGREPRFTELRREGMEVERWNMLHPTEEQRSSWVDRCLAGRKGPKVAATDYMRTYADQIRAWVPGRYVVLGADGFGRSDYRVKLRSFFEVDRYHVAVAALKALADEGAVEQSVVASAIERYEIDTEPVPPWKR